MLYKINLNNCFQKDKKGTKSGSGQDRVKKCVVCARRIPLWAIKEAKKGNTIYCSKCGAVYKMINNKLVFIGLK